MTSNAIKATEVAETRRANREKESQGRRALGQKDRELKLKESENDLKAFDNTRKWWQGGAGLIASNDRSFYDKFDPTLSNELRVAINAYAGIGEKRTQNEVFNASDLGSLVSYLTGNENKIMTAPKEAVFVYEFTPYIGDGGTGDSPVNISIRTFNSYVRSKNFGVGSSYDSVDLFMMPLASDSICTIIAWAKRGLELAKLVDPRDISTKEFGILKAHCFGNMSLVKLYIESPNELINILNRNIVQYNALNLPYQFDYVRRHVFLAGNYFKSEEGVAASYHICNPVTYYTYDEINSELTYNNFASIAAITHASWGWMDTILSSMINPLLDSQSVAIMSGDLLRAFGPDKSTIDLIDIENINYSKRYLAPITDIKYLQSFKNACIANIADNSELTIKQTIINNTPYLHMGTYSGSTWKGIALDTVNVTYNDENALSSAGETSDADVYANNALFDYLDYYDSTVISEEDHLYNLSFVFNGYRRITGARSEIITRFIAYRVDSNSDKQITGTAKLWDSHSNVQFLSAYFESNESALENYTRLVQPFYIASWLQCFNFIPKFAFIYPTQSSGVITWENMLIWSRNHNRRFVTYDNISKVNSISLASMFMIKENKSAVKRRR